MAVGYTQSAVPYDWLETAKRPTSWLSRRRLAAWPASHQPAAEAINTFYITGYSTGVTSATGCRRLRYSQLQRIRLQPASAEARPAYGICYGSAISRRSWWQKLSVAKCGCSMQLNEGCEKLCWNEAVWNEIYSICQKMSISYSISMMISVWQ